MNQDEALPKPEQVILYGHKTCPGVGPVRSMLKRAGVAFEYVNIRQDVTAAAQVRAINNGYESVPTLLFPDGTTLTEPSTLALKRKLEAMGYKVGLLAMLSGGIWSIMLWGIILYAVLRFFELI